MLLIIVFGDHSLYKIDGRPRQSHENPLSSCDACKTSRSWRFLAFGYGVNIRLEEVGTAQNSSLCGFKDPQLVVYLPNIHQRCRSCLGLFCMHHRGFKIRLFEFHLRSEFVKTPSPVSSILFLLSAGYEARRLVVAEFHIHDVSASTSSLVGVGQSIPSNPSRESCKVLERLDPGIASIFRGKANPLPY